MIPAWKIWREFRRLLLQLGRLPKSVVYDPLRRAYYELVERKRIFLRDGEVRETTKIAIYLIFPRTGVLDSHLAALDYMVSTGYSPLVVSNVSLSESDRKIIQTHAWRLMERPNFGYDFGGYRDAILEIQGQLVGLDRLLILNDSAWFPLPGSDDWIKAAENSGLDFAAACSHATAYLMKKSRKRTLGGTGLPDYETFEWDYRFKGNRRFHYASFALSLGPKALRHPGFLRYWKKLRLTNSKPRTVRRGEMGLTAWAIRSGLRHGESLDVPNLPNQLGSLDDEMLRHVAETTVSPEDKRVSRAVAHALRAKNLPREDLIRLILFVVARQGISYAIPNFLVPRGFAFLKKSPVWLDKRTSDITLEVIGGLEGALKDAIMREAIEIRPFPLETKLLTKRGMSRS